MFLIHLWMLQANITALHTLDGSFIIAETELCSTQTYLIIMTKAICQWDELTSQDSVVDLAGRPLPLYFHFRLTNSLISSIWKWICTVLKQLLFKGEN